MTRLRRISALLGLCAVLTACGTISVEEEKKLGAEYQAQLRKELTFVRDPVTVNYVREFGASLVKGARPSPFEFRFFVVEDEEINAFAVPGGAMYVNSGLLMAANNGAELAGVLAHEMGHVTARHVAKNVNKGRATGFVAQIFYLAVAILTGNPYIAQAGGVAAQVGGQAFMSTFTRDAEREADSLAVETMVNSGWNPEGFITMFETLKKESPGGGMPQFLSSHPATDERIENVERDIKNYPGCCDKLRLEDPKLPIIQERLKLLLGTDREKEDKSDRDDGDDEEDDSE